MLGYERAECVGRPIADFEAVPGAFDDIVSRLDPDGAIQGCWLELLRKDGTKRDFELDCNSGILEGVLSYVRCAVRDTNDRVEIENAALRLATIVETSDDAIVSKDLDGTIRSWNAGAERIFGFSAEEAIGNSIRIIIPAERQSEEDAVLEALRNGRKVDHFETVRQRKDGTLIDISLTVSPVKDRSGRIIGASKIARDITLRKSAEEAFRHSVALKDEFLSLVSHELRTPVSVIVGGAKLLRHRGSSLGKEDRDQVIADLEYHGTRLQEVIEHLLLLTRIDSDAELMQELVHVEHVTREVVGDLLHRSPDRTIQVKSLGPLPIAIGSIPLTKILIENLAGNALKYSPPDSVVEINLSSPTPTSVEIEVLDDGIGLTPGDMEHLFSPFFRSRAAQDRASGMGLGLAVCKKIVESLGGQISARPRPGGGACFTATLPAATFEE